MDQSEFGTLRSLRDFLVENGGQVALQRTSPTDVALRTRLDEALLAFRTARRMTNAEMAKKTQSWLRAVRRATGVPVKVLAKRLGVTKYEVFRLEKSEMESRIVLANLKRAAQALGCELVYALVPQHGSLEELATTEREAREMAGNLVRQESAKNAAEAEQWMEWPAVTRRRLRKNLRRMGIRVR
jgi:predicted DNA-binding mobile mystery protein A